MPCLKVEKKIDFHTKKATHMDTRTKGLVYFVVAVHVMFFVLEAIFWMQPFVHTILLVFLDNPVPLDFPMQALTLKKLFINQGFYNLFIALAGVMGLHLLRQGQRSVGCALILFLCCAGAGAGLVLACSTKAYLLAFFQAVPAVIAAARVYPLYKNSVG